MRYLRPCPGEEEDNPDTLLRALGEILLFAGAAYVLIAFLREVYIAWASRPFS